MLRLQCVHLYFKHTHFIIANIAKWKFLKYLLKSIEI